MYYSVFRNSTASTSHNRGRGLAAWAWPLAAVCMLSACKNQTTVQRSYVTNRDQCQIFAEQNLGRFLSPGEETDVRSRNAKLVTLFSDCMFEQGWTVATPEREEEPEFAGTPSPDDLPEFSADALAPARRAPSQQPVTQQPTMQQPQGRSFQPAVPASPTGGGPALSPSPGSTGAMGGAGGTAGATQGR